MQLNEMVEDKRIKDDFMLKLRKSISIQTTNLLVLSGIQETATLTQIEDMAKLAELSETRSRDETTRPIPNSHFGKRKGTSDIKYCINHPNVHSHNTEDCRSKLGKNMDGKRYQSPAFTPHSSSSTSSSSSSSSSSFSTPSQSSTIPSSYSRNNKSTQGEKDKEMRKRTPNDEDWICAVCKKKKPGHLPSECPVKKNGAK